MSNELTELEARHKRLCLLHEAGNVLHSTLDAQEALVLIVKEAVRLTMASSGWAARSIASALSQAP